MELRSMAVELMVVLLTFQSVVQQTIKVVFLVEDLCFLLVEHLGCASLEDQVVGAEFATEQVAEPMLKLTLVEDPT